MPRPAFDAGASGRRTSGVVAVLRGRLTRTATAIAASARARRWVAVRASLALGVPMLIGAATGHLTEGVQASLGGFTALYGSTQPYRRRARLLAILAIAFPAAMVLGTLVGGHPVVTVVVGFVGGVLWTLCSLAIRLGPPREYFVLLVFLLATAMPEDPGAWASRGALVFGGAVLAWAISMTPWLLRRPGPVPGIVAAANDAVARLLDAVGGPTASTAVHDAILAVRAALVATDQARGPRELVWSQRTVAIEQVLDATLAIHVDVAEPLDPRWAARMRAAARPAHDPAPVDGTSHAPPVPSPGPVDPSPPAAGPSPPAADSSPATGRSSPPAADSGTGGVPLPDGPGGPLLAEAVARAESAWRADAPPVPPPTDLELATSWREPARWTFSRASPHPQIAVRVGLAVGGGVALGFLLGLAHPSWVGVSAASVLQARSVSGARDRGIQRAVGTALGVIVAGALFTLDPSDTVKVAAIIVLQFVIQLILRGSYGIAVIGITTMVMFQISLLGAGTVTWLLDARVLDTFVGCAFAGVLLVLLPPRKRTEPLSQAQAETLRATGTLLERALDPAVGAPALLADRKRVHDAIRLLRAAEEAATGEAFGLDPIADARWPVTATIDRTGRQALTVVAPAPSSVRFAGARSTTAPPDDAGPPADDRRGTVDPVARGRLGQRFRAFARRVDGDHAPSPFLDDPVPLRAPLPRIAVSLEELRRQLADLP